MKMYKIWALSGFVMIFGFAPLQTEPWRVDQLMQPEELVGAMKRVDAKRPLIISVGPSAVIEGSVDVGPANKKENMEKLAKLVADQRKDADIVIYCGCCPFVHCPNVRPAFKYLMAEGFTKLKLLNLSHNVREDWMTKGYPTQSTK